MTMTMNPYCTVHKGAPARAANGGTDTYFTRDDIALGLVQRLHRLGLAPEGVTLIEPSAGGGAFLRALWDTFPGRLVFAYDLEPQAAGIRRADWFSVEVPPGCLVVGNPPFGFAASLAIRFFNHAATAADTIAFIVPRSFDKESVQRKLSADFSLTLSERLEPDSFTAGGETKNVPCVFQIWQRTRAPRSMLPRPITNPWFEFITDSRTASLVANAFCVRRVGGRAGQVLNGFGHSPSSTYFIRPKAAGVRRAFLRCQDAFAILRDNTAGVRSLSKREIVAVVTAYMEGDGYR